MSDELRSPEYDDECERRALAYLNHIKGLRIRLLSLRVQLEDARLNLLPGGVRYDTDSVNGSGEADAALVEGLSNVEQFRHDINASLEELTAELDTAHRCVESMPTAMYAAMIRTHYLAGQPWYQTAEHIGYEVTQMYRLRKAALYEFYEYMPHEWRIPKQPAI